MLNFTNNAYVARIHERCVEFCSSRQAALKPFFTPLFARQCRRPSSMLRTTHSDISSGLPREQAQNGLPLDSQGQESTREASSRKSKRKKPKSSSHNPDSGVAISCATNVHISTAAVATEPRMESGSAAAAVLYARYPQMKDLGVVERTGPPHEPQFTVVVSVKGRQFRGVASSKKAAKHEACRAALRELHPDGFGQPVEPGSIEPPNGAVGTDNGHGSDSADSPSLGRRPFLGSKSWNPARRLRSQLCDMRCPAEVSQKFQKSALMLLNELFGSDVEWAEFETCGPPNKRTFRIILKVRVGDGEVREFPGESGKKREAKQVASFTALKQLSTEGEDEDLGENVPNGAVSDDTCAAPKSEDDELAGRAGRQRKTAPRKARKTPLQQLNEMLPNTNFTLIDDVGPPSGRFTFAVTVRGQTFHGTGVSKKEASHRAAAQVLQTIYSINYDEQDLGTSNNDTNEGKSGEAEIEEESTVVDDENGCARGGESPVNDDSSPAAEQASLLYREIAHVSSRKYTELTALIPLTAVGRNIFATIVMHQHGPESDSDDSAIEEGTLPGELNVVAIGTGTKVIDGNCLSTEGNRVHDCHGEVVARRAFVRYLYHQLELCVDSLEALNMSNGDVPPNSSIYEFQSGKGFVLKDGIDFYMYVSSSPCGDGRVFVAADNCSSRKQDNHPRRMSRGLLRYKVEIGEGTLPSGDDHIQTLDGILGGERLRTMSCSDKMLCWNALGLQGTLLTLFIHPVFVKAIVVGNLFSEEHMKRALVSRSVGADLNDDYAASVENPPDLAHFAIQSTLERRDTARAAIHGFDWTSGDDTLEILQGSSGLRVGDLPARICKYALFARFHALRERVVRFASGDMPILKVPADCSYRVAKQNAKPHLSAKKALMSHLEKAHGYWMKKPIEVSDFYL